MKKTHALAIAVLAITGAATTGSAVTRRADVRSAPDANDPARLAAEYVSARRSDDFAAMQTYRPGYAFWQHVFIMPDHSIAYGSGVDGRLLAFFPTKGDWVRDAVWGDPALADILEGEPLSRKLGERREQVASLMEQQAGPVMYNSTRGDALLPNARKYGRFVGEWAAIYERFGVPADIGLAQAILESGLSPSRRSEANAVGFCQWLRKNWTRLNRLSDADIDDNNQTTQAPYCAAYLSVLATKYGSFIPALSEHNAGGTNVGRALINGERLGQTDVRARYLLGAQLARDLRALPGTNYSDVVVSYGPRSYLYSEMIFGNSFNVRHLMESKPQVPIYAMRTPRAISLEEITSRTNLSVEEVQRFNPSLVSRVPAQATLYLPFHVSDFGEDVAFWRTAPSVLYATVLNDFVRLPSGVERWDNPAFAPVLREFRRRFKATHTEEGDVMAAVLTYAMDQSYTSPRRALLSEFRDSERVRRLFARGVVELDGLRQSQPGPAATTALAETVQSDLSKIRNIASP